MDTEEKAHKLEIGKEFSGTQYIKVTHLTVRQSITFLLIKILVLDIIAATLISIFFSSLCQFNAIQSLTDKLLSINTLFFIFLGVSKILLTMYVVVEWLYHYYEITPTQIIKKN